MSCGIDVGKGDHHTVGWDAAGGRLFDKALPNDAAPPRAVFADLAAHGPIPMVADQPNTIGALPVTVARAYGHDFAYLPGLSMRRVADLYPGQAKTDARDAFIIADTARTIPHTLRRVDVGDETHTELGGRRVRRRPCLRGHPDQQPHPRPAHRDPPPQSAQVASCVAEGMPRG